ncbi:MAG: LamG domain-containing protein [Ignavibacteria bacterium]|nr:LamG domain-containing protein [Ignavibacteria bacterium]
MILKLILQSLIMITAFNMLINAQTPIKQVTWLINNLEKIGGKAITVFGNPEIIIDGNSNAVRFDGIDDGIIVHADPLDGATTFTVEIIFKPDTSSNPTNKEQRFLHIQNPDYEPRRMLIELRLTDDKKWFLDTHINTDTTAHTLFADQFKHPLNGWNHAALVYENGTMIHYVNGNEEMRGGIKYLPIKDANVSIGMRMNKRSYFKGEIKLIRITNAALTPDQFVKE